MATLSIWTCSKSPSPVILKLPLPNFSKLVQSKAHWMRQPPGARKPGLRPRSAPSACHSTSSGLLVDPIEVDGVVVVVTTSGRVDGGGTVTVVIVGGAVVVVVARPCSPRQPSMAAIAASPMTPARMTDQRR